MSEQQQWTMAIVDDDEGVAISHPTLYKSDADYGVTVYLPMTADDESNTANLQRLVDLLNEYWPIEGTPEDWYPRMHNGVTLEEAKANGVFLPEEYPWSRVSDEADWKYGG